MAYTIVVMYDLNQAVGRGCPNRQTDVMLVQYFFAAMSISSFNWPRVQVNPAVASGPAPIFPINGQFKDGLVDWIVEFQYQATRNGFGPLVTDGRVDPSGVAWGDSNLRHTHRRTIQAMNLVLQRAAPSRFENLPNDANVPGPLRTELLKIRLTNSLSR